MHTTAPGPYPLTALNRIYELLFCDQPLLFASAEKQGTLYPWNILLAAQPSVEQLQAIAEDDSAESRMQLLAYRRLTETGETITVKKLLAVIVEVGLEGGLDTLAAYHDGTARYLNYSGKTIFWNTATVESKRLIDELFAQSDAVINRIGPWDGQRLSPPTEGRLRLSFLVSDGLYFGQGPFETLYADPMARPVIDAATQLMIFLTQQSL